MIESKYRKGFILVIASALILAIGWWLGSWIVEQKRSQRNDAALRQLISLMAIPEEAGPATKFDIARRFIHRHSRHKSDAAFEKMLGRGDLFAEGMLAHALGRSSEPVHVECSTRSSLMANVLRRLGYKARIAYVFDTDPKKKDGNVPSHTFLDVYNPDTGKWESHDPDYDVFWRSVHDGARISIFEAPENLAEIEPCNQTRCDWDLVSDEGREIRKIHELIDIVSIVDKSTN